ncbi:hypothetical protein D910_11478 [Dendroctonus ponderosae]|uniref:Uncharacterized protein n=1 Tax=Dendroctonus ponderosae TaxID=77166 RepID=U4UM54_DENPD|nr:hypothetical protein D910_11478 [Dendroctonus ponderosae]
MNPRRKPRKINKPKTKLDEMENCNQYAFFNANELAQIKSALRIKEVNNTTALIWAVKLKYLDMIEFLLNNGADPNMKVENGENTVLIALEHKLWDEQSFMEYWGMVSKVSRIEVNAINKNGHTILHIAVRREWEKLIKLLLTQKVSLISFPLYIAKVVLSRPIWISPTSMESPP